VTNNATQAQFADIDPGLRGLKANELALIVALDKRARFGPQLSCQPTNYSVRLEIFSILASRMASTAVHEQPFCLRPKSGPEARKKDDQADDHPFKRFYTVQLSLTEMQKAVYFLDACRCGRSLSHSAHRTAVVTVVSIVAKRWLDGGVETDERRNRRPLLEAPSVKELFGCNNNT
jgi:hypothetical protein